MNGKSLVKDETIFSNPCIIMGSLLLIIVGLVGWRNSDALKSYLFSAEDEVIISTNEKKDDQTALSSVELLQRRITLGGIKEVYENIEIINEIMNLYLYLPNKSEITFPYYNNPQKIKIKLNDLEAGGKIEIAKRAIFGMKANHAHAIPLFAKAILDSSQVI